MVTKKLKLQVVIDLIKPVESLLNQKIDVYKKSGKSSKDVIAYITLLQAQLVILKLAKDKGNAKKHNIFGKSNSYWIYKLSELKRISNLGLSKTDQRKLDEDITKAEELLSKHNSTTILKVQLFPEVIQEFKL